MERTVYVKFSYLLKRYGPIKYLNYIYIWLCLHKTISSEATVSWWYLLDLQNYELQIIRNIEVINDWQALRWILLSMTSIDMLAKKHAAHLVQPVRLHGRLENEPDADSFLAGGKTWPYSHEAISPYRDETTEVSIRIHSRLPSWPRKVLRLSHE